MKSLTNVARLGMVGMLTCSLAFAQQDFDAAEVLPEATPPQPFRIGLAGEPVPEALRAHLDIPEDGGLLVSAVVDDSPASRAGIKRFDVIVTANGTVIGNVADLAREVNNAKASEMTLSVIQRGESRQLSVTPEERTEDFPVRRELLRDRLGERGFEGLESLPPQIRRQLQQFEEVFPQRGLGGFGWGRILPGIVMDEDEETRYEMPNNFSMQVEKQNDAPAKIKVRRGKETWEVTEDDIDDLPEDLRPMVRNMLRGRGVGAALSGPPSRPFRGRVRRGSGAAAEQQQLKDRFDGLELQLQQLQDAIRSMQEE